jgi:hypothetical protein
MPTNPSPQLVILKSAAAPTTDLIVLKEVTADNLLSKALNLWPSAAYPTGHVKYRSPHRDVDGRVPAAGGEVKQ